MFLVNRERNDSRMKVALINKRETNGITLIALIVTIIVLLILTGITVSLVITNNGILNLAKKSRENYNNAQEKELADIDRLYSSIQIATNNDAQITVSIEDLNKIIDDKVNKKVEEKVNEKSEALAVPAGTVISFMGNVVPEGYLACNGEEKNIADYPVLAAQIEANFGTKNHYGGDGTTTFKVPNLQGEFLRGTGSNGHSNQGSGANVGLHQDATTISRTAINYPRGRNGC